MASNNLNTDEEIYAIESKKDIVLQMSFTNKIYRMVLGFIGEGDGIQLYSRKKITYFDAQNGITPKTRTEETEYAGVSTIDDELYTLLRIWRTNGYKIISPVKNV